MNLLTRNLGLRQRVLGSNLPRRLTNCWGDEINRELAVIDEAIGALCTTEQVESIKRALFSTREGVIL